MPFEELTAPVQAARGIGTGARVSISIRRGVIVSVAGDAMAALGGCPEGDRYIVLIDRDPALPRLRIVRAADGGFKASRPPLGDRWRMIRLGRDTGLPQLVLKGLDCAWERVEGKPAIDIDLPRELRGTSQHQPVGRPSVSTSDPPRPVTLPARGNLAVPATTTARRAPVGTARGP